MSTEFLVVAVGISLLGATICVAMMVFRLLFHVEQIQKSNESQRVEAWKSLERLSEKLISDVAIGYHSRERAQPKANGEQPIGSPYAPAGNIFQDMPFPDETMGEGKGDPVMQMNPMQRG